MSKPQHAEAKPAFYLYTTNDPRFIALRHACNLTTMHGAWKLKADKREPQWQRNIALLQAHMPYYDPETARRALRTIDNITPAHAR